MELVVYEYGVPHRRSPGQIIYAAEANLDAVHSLIPAAELRRLHIVPFERLATDAPGVFEDRAHVWGKRRVSRFRRLLREGGAELDRRWVEYAVVEAWETARNQALYARNQARSGLGPEPDVLS